MIRYLFDSILLHLLGAHWRSWVEDWVGINHLLRANYLHDPDTERHAMRVADLALAIGRQLGLRGMDLSNLWMAALLHDVGKLGIPLSIINKPGRLDADQWREMQRHPLIAYPMLIPVAAQRQLLDAALYHHEHFDGSGYPFGLTGVDIPLTAQIVSVVDAFDAISSERPYHTARTIAETKAIMDAESGRTFNPVIVAALWVALHINEE